MTSPNPRCIRCIIGQHGSCSQWDVAFDRCCDNGMSGQMQTVAADIVEASAEPERVTRRYKSDAAMKDQQSTGRKRAAVMYPLDIEASCEWQGLGKAGGGKFPIAGCLVSEDRKQGHRHHGPDKNTLNNEEGNVHRICTFCHNRWHTKNDDSYIAGAIQNPHDPATKATQEEAAMVPFESIITPHTHKENE